MAPTSQIYLSLSFILLIFLVPTYQVQLSPFIQICIISYSNRKLKHKKLINCLLQEFKRSLHHHRHLSPSFLCIIFFFVVCLASRSLSRTRTFQSSGHCIKYLSHNRFLSLSRSINHLLQITNYIQTLVRCIQPCTP